MLDHGGVEGKFETDHLVSVGALTLWLRAALNDRAVFAFDTGCPLESMGAVRTVVREVFELANAEPNLEVVDSLTNTWRGAITIMAVFQAY